MQKAALATMCVLAWCAFGAQAFAVDVDLSSGVTVSACVDDAGSCATGTSGTTGGTTSGSTSGTTGGTTGGSSGGGSGGGWSFVPASVIFSGRAYPLSRVILLKDGQEALSTIAGPDARFSMSIGNLTAGTFTFSILSEDSKGRRSTLFTVPIAVTSGVSSTISGIFLAPTIAVDKRSVKRGDSITIFGETAPGSEVTVSVHSETEIVRQVRSDRNGAYFYTLNTAPLEYGTHETKAKTEIVETNETAPYGQTLSFVVGESNVASESACPLLRGDFNADCRVNLVDFSIMSYWYKKTGFPKKVDISGDGKITFVDFSILAYHWTG